MMMTSLALFPSGFAQSDEAGDVALDRIVPVVRAVDIPTLSIVGQRDMIFIEGWATAGATRRPADGVYINIDGAAVISAVMGTERNDVAALHGPQSLTAGFRGIVPVAKLAPGFHNISVSILNGAEHTYRNTGETRILVVDPRARVPGSDGVCFETIGLADSADPARVGALSVPYGSRVRIRGWAVHPSDKRAVCSVALIVSDKNVCEASFGQARSEIARTQGLEREDIGFEAVIGTEIFGTGTHEIRARTFSMTGEALNDSAGSISLEVLGGGN